jgi:hypothetical protein
MSLRFQQFVNGRGFPVLIGIVQLKAFPAQLAPVPAILGSIPLKSSVKNASNVVQVHLLLPHFAIFHIGSLFQVIGSLHRHLGWHWHFALPR